MRRVKMTVEWKCWDEQWKWYCEDEKSRWWKIQGWKVRSWRITQRLLILLKKSFNANIQLRKHWELPYFTSSCPHPPPPPHSMEGRKKEMLMTLVRHPRNSHPEMDSPFKIPSKYAPDEGRIGSFFWDGARSSPYFTHNALGQKMLNAFLV